MKSSRSGIDTITPLTLCKYNKSESPFSIAVRLALVPSHFEILQVYQRPQQFFFYQVYFAPVVNSASPELLQVSAIPLKN